MTSSVLLWFDVEKKRYTTRDLLNLETGELWFDVEKKRYTTYSYAFLVTISCGLM